MRFIEEVTANANDIWEQCAALDFLMEMGDGTLDRERFMDYIVQDSIYLRDYMKAYAMAMFKSRTLREMQIFYSVLGYVNDSENATRLGYLSDNNMTDDDVEDVAKKPACEEYTGLLIKYAENEDLPEILMAVLPCMIGYYDVFKLLRDKKPQVMETYYGKLVADYTSDGYKECCDYWMDFANEICEPLDDERKAKLKDIYMELSMQELYFWEMFN